MIHQIKHIIALVFLWILLVLSTVALPAAATALEHGFFSAPPWNSSMFAVSIVLFAVWVVHVAVTIILSGVSLVELGILSETPRDGGYLTKEEKRCAYCSRTYDTEKCPGCGNSVKPDV